MTTLRHEIPHTFDTLAAGETIELSCAGLDSITFQVTAGGAAEVRALGTLATTTDGAVFALLPTGSMALGAAGSLIATIESVGIRFLKLEHLSGAPVTITANGRANLADVLMWKKS